MNTTGTLHDAFIDELRDTHDAERQLIKALTKLAKAATNPSCQRAERGSRKAASIRLRRTLRASLMYPRARGAQPRRS
jgi:hypothetical protein